MLTPLGIRQWRGASLLLLGSAVALPLTPAWASSNVNAAAACVDVTVQGRVTDDKGAPLPGATIIVKGAAGVGASTDAEGNFSLTLPTGNETIVVSSIGFVAQELSVAGRTSLTIQMVTDSKALDEVVVVGYGTQKRSDITGAVGSVSSTEIMERPAVNIAQSLQGRVAGVDVNLNSGQPGSSPIIRVRGYGSINAGNNPLYVVDGVFWDAGITSLNPNDIESIEVLKDASATAIYGAQGSNGVILVTTKRGKKGARVSYDTFVSLSKIARKLNLLDSRQFLAAEDLAYQNLQKFDPTGWAAGNYTNRDPKLKRRALANPNDPKRLFDDSLNPLYDTDWQDETTRTGVTQSHNLSFSGGGDQLTYGLFLNYTNAQGTIQNTYQKRYNARLVVDNQVKKWLKIGATINYANIEDRVGNDFVGGNNIPRMMIEMIPIMPVKYPNGTYAKRQDYPDMESGDNPVAIATEDEELRRRQVFSANGYGDFTILPGLNFRTVLGANIESRMYPSFASNLIQLRAQQSFASISAYDGKGLQWQNYLTYTKQFGQNHSLNAVVGVDTRRFRSLAAGVETRGLIDNGFGFYNLGVGSTPSPPTSDYQADQFFSIFGRINYGFKDRYLLTLTTRRDGSSRFGQDNKNAIFPSAAIAWRISEEDFLRGNSLISDLKLRFGYGRTGNSGPDFGNYVSQTLLSTNSYVISGNRINGIRLGTLGNPTLRWETADQFDLGLNVGLLQNRVTFEGDVYQRTTKDLLLQAPVPRSSGYGSYPSNIGSVRNRGLELALNTVNVQTTDFTWSTTFNISFLQNRILALGAAGDDIFPGPNFLNETNVLRVGQPVGSFFGLERLGTWSTAEADQALRYNRLPGDLKFKDQNNDGQINDQDRVILGKNIPTGYGSFINTLRYRGFDLMLDLQFTYGNDVMNLTHHSALDRTGQANSYERALTEAWTPENQNTSIAQVRPSYLRYDSRIDSYKVEDGSFIRGRNLVLGYNFSAGLTEKLKLSRLRVYASAQNFFLFTKYKGYDPETSTFTNAFSQGIQFFDYPKARTITAGLNVSF
ncbi:SusC/RagA family TonB-linked outer membrane protein [Hymenobacter wooponensis]|uniref:TonB-dependent receptor n=1 Tax=Hymenobacter wooponensis TaxID=1525360 RepID=A0A4Z0MN52_9BACT|nr:TonB-dependent receptor [Hymenobacter wooponensis]TGD80776.1 TonB-dependent receptor [Hymenobacter wooponensis]